MIFGVILDSNEEEHKRICRRFSELTAYYTDDRLEMKTFIKSSLLLPEIEKSSLLDAAVIDVTLPGGLDAARFIRKKFPETEIMVIADASVSPMTYMHPMIRAASLLLRPVTHDWEKAIRDFFDQIRRKSCREGCGNVLWVENRDGTFRIPFEQIYYLEAREKKVFIRTKTEEYGMNNTMEKLAGQLPEYFIRCHRSFIVNTNFVVRVKMSENMLYLREELFVPISRSYKGIFKRHINE